MEGRRVPRVVIENVYFTLRLKKGSGIADVLDALESIGYCWAFWVVDSRSLGLAQRCRRAFMDDLGGDSQHVLMIDDVEERDPGRFADGDHL